MEHGGRGAWSHAGDGSRGQRGKLGVATALRRTGAGVGSARKVGGGEGTLW